MVIDTNIKPMLLYGFGPQVSAWVAERIPEATGGWEKCEAIGVISNDGKRLIAGVVYSDYFPEHRTMQLHIAADSPMWARRENIIELLDYPFNQLDVYKCWISILHTNEKSLRATKHIGFKDEGTLKHQFGPGRHAVMRYMLKPDYMEMAKGIKI